jgi:hypothetical protein
MFVNALRKVFRSPVNILVATATSLILFMFAVLLPNFRLIWMVTASSDTTLSQKLRIPIGLLGSISTNFSTLSAVYTILISLLFGINVVMTVYYMKRRVRGVETGGIVAGFFGTMSGIFGLGCAACGSLILTSVISLAGASSILALLPLRGGEFGIIGIILLSVSIYIAAKKIQNPAVCKIN